MATPTSTPDNVDFDYDYFLRDFYGDSPTAVVDTGTTGAATLPRSPTGITPRSDVDRLTAYDVMTEEAAEAFVGEFGDVEIPLTEVEKGEYSRQALEDGSMVKAVGVDARALKEKIRIALEDRAFNNYMREHGRPPEDEEAMALYQDSDQRATRWLRETLQKQTGVNPNATPEQVFRLLLVDKDPGQVQEGIRQWAKDSTWGRLLAPFSAAWMGTRIDVLDPEKGGVSQYNDGSEILNGLDWLFRVQDPFTYISTAIIAGGSKESALVGTDGLFDTFHAFSPLAIPELVRGWGSEEHLRLLEQGKDLIALSPELEMGRGIGAYRWAGDGLEAALVGAGVTSAEGLGKNIADYGTGFIVSVMSPDLMSLATFGASKVARPMIRGALALAGVDAVTTMTRKGRTSHEAAEALVTKLLEARETGDAVDMGVLVSRTMDDVTKGLSPSEAAAVRSAVAGVIATKPNMSPETAGMIGKAIAAADQVATPQGLRGAEESLERVRRAAGIVEGEDVGEKLLRAQQRVLSLEQELQTARQATKEARDPDLIKALTADLRAAQGQEAALRKAHTWEVPGGPGGRAARVTQDPLVKQMDAGLTAAEAKVRAKERELLALQDQMDALSTPVTPTFTKVVDDAKLTEDLVMGSSTEVTKRLRGMNLTPEQIDHVIALENAPKAATTTHRAQKGGRKAVVQFLERKKERTIREAGGFSDEARKAEMARVQSKMDALRKDIKGTRGPAVVAREWSVNAWHSQVRKHAVIVGALADLRGSLRLARELSALSRGATKRTVSDGSTLAKGVEDAAKEVSEAHVKLWEARNLQEFQDAEKALGAAQTNHSKALYELTQHNTDSAIEQLVLKVKALEGLETQARDAVTATAQAGAQAGFGDKTAAALSKHLKDMERVSQGVSTAGRRDAPALALATALKSMGDEYLKLADVARKSDLLTSRGTVRHVLGEGLEGTVPLATLAETAWYANRVSHSRGLTKAFHQMTEWFTNFANPAIKKAATLDEDFQQIYARMVGETDFAIRETTEVLRTAQKNGKSRAQAVVDYLDSTEAVRLSETSSTLLSDVNGGRTRWQAAFPMFQAHMGALIKGTTTPLDEVAGVHAILRSWLPKGHDLRGAEGAFDSAMAKKLQDWMDTLRESPSFGEVMQAIEKFTPEVLEPLTRHQAGAPAAQAMVKGVMSGEAPRAYALAAMGAQEIATLANTAARVKRAIGHEYASPVYEAARRMIQGAARGEDIPPEAWADAIDLLNKMAMDVTRSKAPVNGRDVALTLARLSGETPGDPVFLPTVWLRATNERIGRFVKTGQVYKGSIYDPVEDTLRNTVYSGFRLFNTSLISGLVFPRPMHFMNIFFGNFAQVWGELGPMAAAGYAGRAATDVVRWSSQSLGSFIPFGKHIDDGMKMAKGADPHALGTPTNAMGNPHVGVIYDPAKFPGSQVVTGADGRQFTLSELRRAIIDQGVLSSFTSSSGLAQALARKMEPKMHHKVGETLTTFGRMYTEVAEVIEQRQRVALFTDLVMNQGKSLDEAGRITRNALYDWNYPMTNFETNVLQNVMMFYTFQKRALGQGLRMLFDPVVKGLSPDITLAQAAKKSLGGSLGAQAMGETPFHTTNIRDMGRALAALRGVYSGDKDHIPDYDGDGVVTEEDEMAHLLRVVYPWYASRPGSRTPFANIPMDAQDTEYFRRHFGRNFTHEALTMPSFTPIEMTNIYTQAMSLLGAWAVGGVNEVVRGETGAQRPGTAETAYAMSKLVSEMGGPMSGEMLKGLFNATIGKDEQYHRNKKGARVTKHTDKYVLAFLSNYGLAGNLVYNDLEEPGVVRVDPVVKQLYQLVPVLGNEIPNTLEPIVNMPPSRKENLTTMMGWLAGQYLGVGKVAFHEPMETVAWDWRQTEDDVKALQKRVEQLEPTTFQSIGEGVDPDTVQPVLDRFSTRSRGSRGHGGGLRVREPRLTRKQAALLFQPKVD